MQKEGNNKSSLEKVNTQEKGIARLTENCVSESSFIDAIWDACEYFNNSIKKLYERYRSKKS